MGNWFYWALCSAVLAAMTAIFTKIGLKDVDSDYAALIPTFVIATLLAVYVHFSGKWINPLTLRSGTLLSLTLSGVATGASWICYFRALKASDAAKVASVDKLSVVLVALFAFIFLSERPSTREWLAISLIGAGVFMLGWKR